MDEVYELSHRENGQGCVVSYHLTLEGAQTASQELELEPRDGWDSWKHPYDDIWSLYCVIGVLIIRKLEVEP